MKQNPTSAIKSKFSNEVHKILEPNIGIKTRQRWQHKQKFTDAQKLEMFEQIVQLHNECTRELTAYQYDRREKKRIQKARIARGWKPKVKTRKEDYLKKAA